MVNNHNGLDNQLNSSVVMGQVVNDPVYQGNGVVGDNRMVREEVPFQMNVPSGINPAGWKVLNNP